MPFLLDRTYKMTISEFFKHNNKIALAFSGGVDSAYLLYEAKKAGADVTAYFVHSPFQPDFELKDARRLARELKACMKILPFDVLQDENVRNNPTNRCYYCKQHIFRNIIASAKKDGYSLVIDGTNASDDASDRPGMVALRELSVRSPLRECGLTKDTIRQYSKEAGLFTWNKPAYACLATRIPSGEIITEEKLKKTEWAESWLASLGYVDFRVRMVGNQAKLQIRKEQFPQMCSQLDSIRAKLLEKYDNVIVDQEGR